MFVNLVILRPGDFQRQRHIFKGGEMIKQAEILKHDADLAAHGRQIIARNARNFLVEQRNQASAWPMGKGEQFEQGTFPRARRAGEKMKGSGLQVKTDIAQHLRSEAISHSDIFKPDHSSSGQNASEHKL